ncbi:hypothetical protein [Phycicoccus sp. HDW14]|uniref:hypothetical protein n=1 Tax=Phycicoccus sp. HDW14 TaxID=2714941 RepID=UPI00197B1F9F|nr:hypothetical protein [Phycicoccus sp. HDW14]
MHVFESRSKVFADTGVLQENVIIAGTKGAQPCPVSISVSVDHREDQTIRTVPYADIVDPKDPHRFIRMAANDSDTQVAQRMVALPCTLADLGVRVSTGPVVDFRSRDLLHTEPIDGGRPLIYPGNIRNGRVEWPLAIRKAQWYRVEDAGAEKLLVPEGWYTVIKRFSAKEERRRIVAAVWSPEVQSGAVAFENHLNYLHLGGAGLDRDLAHGFSLWLNSTFVDQFFRTFSGHTQVNATDLRTMRFPSMSTLRTLGSQASTPLPEQTEIDALVDAALAGTDAAA